MPQEQAAVSASVDGERILGVIVGVRVVIENNLTDRGDAVKKTLLVVSGLGQVSSPFPRCTSPSRSYP